MLARLNSILFLPSPTVLVVNGIIFAFIFILVIVFGYFSDKIGDVTKPLYITDDSVLTTIAVLMGGLMATCAMIYAKTRKHFLCWRQCLNASVGTTLLITLLYACIWSLIQIAKGYQHFVVFDLQAWSLQPTLNNLKYGSFLFALSSISFLLSSLAVSQPGYDFGPFLVDWKNWRRLIRTLENNKPLSNKDEYENLLSLTRGMLNQVDSIDAAEYVQPVSLRSLKQLRPSLDRFVNWYLDQVSPGTGNLARIDAEIMPDVQRVIRLCGNEVRVAND